MTISTTVKNSIFGAVLAGAALFGPGAGSAMAAAPTACFNMSDWTSWTAPSRDVLLLRVRMHDVYRVDLVSGSNQLKMPGNYLISTVRGNARVCSPIDLDLKVADQFGPGMPLMAKAITRLNPDEIAALPKKDRP